MKFRNYVLTNFPFLENDFDALTDYELFSKMVCYMKKALNQITAYEEKLTAFENELNEFENYFNNLDVQDEIDNKLDVMYENGQLQSIIEEFIDLQVVFTYNNVADLKLATNLINGSFVRTSGYTTFNDLGGALYKVRNKEVSDVIDEKKIIALYDQNLVAEIIPLNVMNPKQFGAIGDGIVDDTDSIQLCINTCKNVLITDGVYMVDAADSIKPVSNSNIKLVNATIKAIANNLTNYAVVMLDNVHDVIISGGTIEGDRLTHDGSSGEWGHGIYIKGASYNVKLSDITIKNTWGDGLYINDAVNVNSQNLYIDSARRNGISIINCDTYHSLNDYVYNTNGTLPESGLDIEPNGSTDKIKNIIIDNFTTKNNNGEGIDIILTNLNATSDDVSVNINNAKIENCNVGVKEGHPNTIKGIINFNNINILNVQNNGMDLAARYSANGVRINIINPYIKNYNLSASSKHGIDLGAGDSNWGNVYIKNSYIETNDVGVVNATAITPGGYAIYHPVNVIIDTPLNKQCNIYTAYGENIKIIDPYGFYTSNDLTDNANVLNIGDINATYTNEGFTSNVTVVPRNYTNIGMDVTFRKIGSGNLTVRLAAGEYCHALSDSERPRITLTKVGESITLRKISSTEWIPINIVGSPEITT